MKSNQNVGLSLLLITDTHFDTNALNSFKRWYESEERKYDYVIHTGDFSNILSKEANDPRMQGIGEYNMQQTINFLFEVTQVPMLYIPGNHDPVSSFTRSISYKNSINLHKNAFQIRDNLVVFGVGGSHYATQKVGDKDEHIWDYFPYQDDETFYKDCSDTYKSAKQQFGDCDYIFLTHMGPDNSSTTVLPVENQNPIHCGSILLENILNDNSQNIIALIHGHYHESEGLNKFQLTDQQCIHAGGLLIGHCADIHLINRIDKPNRWKINSTKYYNFD